MRFRDIPRVVRYLPDLAEVFPDGEKITVKGIELEVCDCVADGVWLKLPEDVKLQYVLETGETMEADVWFERYIHNIDMEPMYEDSREDTIDSVPVNEGGEGQTELFPNGDAGEREDDARSVLTKAFDIFAE